MELLQQIVVTKIEEVFTVHSPKGRVETIENRYCYGLSLCRSGQITYVHNGNRYVSDPDHAVILPLGQTYTLYGEKTGLFPVINFQCHGFLCDTVCVLPLHGAADCFTAYEQLKEAFLFPENRLRALGLFYGLLHRVLSAAPQRSALLAPALQYAENHYGDPSLTNTVLARQCGISEVYFRKRFTEEYGVPPKHYIAEIRLNRARQLLTESALKITEVAERCGFSSPYHFCRIFKQKCGVAPTEYRRRHRVRSI